MRPCLRPPAPAELLPDQHDAHGAHGAAPPNPDASPSLPPPMDLTTLLFRVDGRQYATVHAFLTDVALIVQVRALGPRAWVVHRAGGCDVGRCSLRRRGLIRA